MTPGKNTRLLADWLRESYSIEQADEGPSFEDMTVPDESGKVTAEPIAQENNPPSLQGQFDLCILDGPAVERHSKDLIARKRAEGNTFLPFLLIAPSHNIGRILRHSAQIIDETVPIPIERTELRRIIETLVRRRLLSCTLNKDKLLLQDENAQLVKALLQAERMAAIGQAITGVAHCIKNLLQGLQGGMFMLKKAIKKSNADVPERVVDVLDRNFTQMEELVLDMLTYSKEREPEYEIVDLNKVVCSVADLMRPKAEGKKVEIRFEPGAGLTEVHIDPKGIYRCVLNLVSNACDACDIGGSVNMVTRATSDGRVVIEVSDNGCGMDEETLGRIYDAFFSTKGSKGTGLGLSVTQKIVKEHNGTIDVHSELGKGSTFQILLPKGDIRAGK
jgi:signal transduction histidine kinase